MASSLLAPRGVRRRAAPFSGPAVAISDDEEIPLLVVNGPRHCGVNNSNSNEDEAKLHQASKGNWAQQVDWILACRCVPRQRLAKIRSWVVVSLHVLILLVLTWVTYLRWTQWKKQTITTERQTEQNIQLQFANITLKAQFSVPSSPLLLLPGSVDFGGVDVESINHNGRFLRKVHADDYEIAEKQRIELLAEDATKVIPFRYWYNDDLESLHFPCRRPNWATLHVLNCNTFHEISLDRDYLEENYVAYPVADLQEYDNYLVNHGYYRDDWVTRKPGDGTTTVFKTTRTHFDFGWRNLFDVHREALIMERLTSFPNIVTSYGHCGTSVLTEAVPHEVERYVVPGTGYSNNGGEPPEVSRNHLSAEEKLQTALEMAESIAVLHGYEGGVIIHNDIQLQQWLRTDEGTLKLGDFNRASIPDWDMKEKRYCKYSTGAAFGNVSWCWLVV